MSGRTDLAGLIGGLAVALLGTALLLDATGGWDLDFGGVIPLVLAAVGATLLAGGLSRRA